LYRYKENDRESRTAREWSWDKCNYTPKQTTLTLTNDTDSKTETETKMRKP